ncbi:choice-of-anchor Q domain-containing protein [Hugenholtzia roseola]|uniref:choice-of-anchor Q domain-containing protein n=1 Tax=Hugenholtzia roseola TaxID=1002 RepID=UPI0004225C01|nr:choice-of-anchor Q domain-containing protein [Hugenholtzia roseola]
MQTLLQKVGFSFFLLSFFLLSTQISAQTTFYVSAFGNNANTGLDWDNALQTIDQAIISATPLATGGNLVRIYVEQGTYLATPALSLNNLDSLAIYGGFDQFSAPTFAERDPEIYVTTIEGNATNRIFEINDSKVRIDGFLLRDGVAATSGAGAVANNSTVSIVSCLFRENNIAISGSSPSVEARGAAFVAFSSDIYLENTAFIQNKIETFDGAAPFLTTSPILKGGAIYAENSTLVVLDSRFEENSVVANNPQDLSLSNTVQGGAIYLNNSPCGIRRSIFRNNAANSSVEYTSAGTQLGQGGAIYHQGNSPIQMRNVFFEGNVVSIDNSTGNVVAEGGAVYSAGLNANRLHMAGCYFLNNQVTDLITGTYFTGSVFRGGAVYTAETYLFNSYFKNNESLQDAGGVFLSSAGTVASVFANTIFQNNLSLNQAGALQIVAGANAIVAYSTFVGNDSQVGEAVRITANTSVRHCIFQDNTEDGVSGAFHVTAAQDVTGSTLVQTPAYGSNDNSTIIFISSDDLRPLCNQPTINSIATPTVIADLLDIDADGDVAENLPYDFSGLARLNGNIDQGAYEYQDKYIFYAQTEGSNPDISNGSTWVLAFGNGNLDPILGNINIISATCPNIEVWTKGNETNYYTSSQAGATVTLQNNVKWYGGFRGFEQDPNNRVLTDSTRSKIQRSVGQNHIFQGIGIDDTAIIDGFSIENGFAVGAAPDNNGGGIFLQNSQVPVRNCFIRNNYADNSGGGVYLESVNNRFENCRIENNSVNLSNGGGVFVLNSIVEFANTIFFENQTFNNAVAGGGIYSNSSTTRLLACTVVKNACLGTSAQGGGLYYDGGTVAIQGSIFWGNFAETDPQIGGTATLIEANNIVEGGFNTALTEDPNFWESDFNQDPLFLLPKPCSPALNAGDNGLAVPSTDDFGNPRIFDGTMDIGAREAQSAPSPAPVIYVRAGASGNGDSWDSPVGTLQEALDLYDGCREIWIAEGTYLPDNQIGTLPQTQTFLLNDTHDEIRILGGFPDNLTSAADGDISLRDFAANPTILSGDIGITGDDSDNAYHILYIQADFDTELYLDGLTFSQGNAIGTSLDAEGGAIHAISGDLDVRNCNFIANKAIANGAAIFYNPDFNATSGNFFNCLFEDNQIIGTDNEDGGTFALTRMGGDTSLSLDSCVFENNSSLGSAGAFLAYGNINFVSFSKCNFKDNTAQFAGGALYVTDNAFNINLDSCYFESNSAVFGGGAIVITDGTTGFNITRSIFEENQASNGQGGAINASNSQFKLMDCLLHDNEASSDGGAIFIFNDAGTPPTKFVNVTFADNVAGLSGAGQGGALYNQLSSNGLEIYNCIFWDNERDGSDNSGISSEFTGIFPDIMPAATNLVQDGSAFGFIFEDPRFLDPAQDDYRLFSNCGSPALEAGDNAIVETSFDLAGQNRIIDTNVELGAYESSGAEMLNAPIGFSAVALDAASINLTWDAYPLSPAIDGFKIQVDTNTLAPVHIQTLYLPAAPNSFLHTGLASQTEYFYTAAAYRVLAVGDTCFSLPITSATTTLAPTPPNQATCGANSVVALPVQYLDCDYSMDSVLLRFTAQINLNSSDSQFVSLDFKYRQDNLTNYTTIHSLSAVVFGANTYTFVYDTLLPRQSVFSYQVELRDCNNSAFFDEFEDFVVPAYFGSNLFEASYQVCAGEMVSILIESDSLMPASSDAPFIRFRWEQSFDGNTWSFLSDSAYLENVEVPSAFFLRRIVSAQANLTTNNSNSAAICTDISPIIEVLRLERFVSEADSLILVDIYQNTAGTNWTNTWDLTEPVLNWAGVEICNGSVIALNLSNNNLRGVVPTSVQNFSFPALNFNTSGNYLDFESFEPNVSALPNWIYSNQAKINDQQYIEILQGNDTTLQVSTYGNFNTYQWYKDNQPLTGQTASTLLLENVTPQAAGIYTCWVRNTVATDLTLIRNDIQVNVLPFVPTADSLVLVLFNQATGGENWFRKWNFEDPVATWEGIKFENGVVTEIDLSSNNLSGSIPDVFFADSIRILRQLRYLNLFDNQLVGTLPPTFFNLVSLQYLDLSKNAFSGAIPTEIERLQDLITLWLSQNRLTSLPENIGNLSRLENLYLSHNQFESLPAQIGNLSRLRTLYFDYNQITVIPAAWETLDALQTWEGSSNKVVNMPFSLATLPALRSFALSDNALLNFTEAFPPLLDKVSVDRNALDFGDFEPLMAAANRQLSEFNYSPQADINEALTILVELGEPLSFAVQTEGRFNRYQWYQDNTFIFNQTNAQRSTTRANYTWAGVHFALVKNDLVPNLTLRRRNIEVQIDCDSSLLAIQTQDPLSFCQAQEVRVRMQVENIAGFRYQWFRNGLPLAFATDASLTTTLAGRYFVQISEASGCNRKTEEIEIRVGVVEPIFVQNANLLIDQTQAQNPTQNLTVLTRQWYRDGNALAGANDSILQVQVSGEYRLELMLESGCLALSAPKTVSVTALDVPISQGNLSLVLFPNPTQNILNLRFEGVGNGVESSVALQKVELYDATGRKVASPIFEMQSIGHYQLTLESSLARGWYQIRIYTKEKIFQSGILIE